jgi:RNA polymerase sigma factor (sigma-70 family)
LAADNMGLVYRAIQQLRIAEPWRQEAESDGMLGLIYAARSYDPASKTKFGTYAYVCIERKMKNTLQRLANQNKRRVDPSESADGLDVVYHDPQVEQVAPDVPRGLSVFGEMARQVDKLPAKARFIVKAKYVHGWPQYRIAKRLGCSGETVGRIHRIALRALRGEVVVWPWDAAKMTREQRAEASRMAWAARKAAREANGDAINSGAGV